MSETEKKDLSWDELMSQIKSPEMLQAAAAKFGLKLESPKPPEKKKRELPTFDLPEDASPADVIKVMNQGFAAMFKMMDEISEEKVSSIRGELSQKEIASAADKVRKFASTKEDFKDLISFIEPFYATGKYSIEEAYDLGKRASGKATEKPKSEETSTEGESKVDLSKISEETGTRGKLSAKVTSVRDSAKKQLEQMIASGKTGGMEEDKDEIK